MFLKKLSLQNFRSYAHRSFTFNNQTTVIVGPNTSGKTNLLEAISLLSMGKSFKGEKETSFIHFGELLSRIEGKIDDTDLEIRISESTDGRDIPTKKYLVNGVSKRRVDFASHLPTVLFSPADLELIIGSPSLRREFLNSVLEQVDTQYRYSLQQYMKALRQRNALLEISKDTGVRNERQFEYWDALLIETGTIITEKREALISYMNQQVKEVFPLILIYDKSTISEERLLQYKNAEIGAGVTLVGPHRDDFIIEIFESKSNKNHNIKSYGSRGQQRLAVLQLKFLQLSYMIEKRGDRPVLLLDDIFSELDEGHIQLVLSLLGKQQTIMTTTHKEFLRGASLLDSDVIELKK